MHRRKNDKHAVLPNPAVAVRCAAQSFVIAERDCVMGMLFICLLIFSFFALCARVYVWILERRETRLKAQADAAPPPS